jgi:hypothetical protein
LRIYLWITLSTDESLTSGFGFLEVVADGPGSPGVVELDGFDEDAFPAAVPDAEAFFVPFAAAEPLPDALLLPLTVELLTDFEAAPAARGAGLAPLPAAAAAEVEAFGGMAALHHSCARV